MIEHSFKVGGWLVEKKLGRISKTSELVQLEPQVMKVLCCLAEHAGEVVTKKYLTESLWQSSYVSDAALARCISQIRIALGDSGKNPKYVQTIPKIGYRLIANVQLNSKTRFSEKLPRLTRPVAAAAAASISAILVFSYTAASLSPKVVQALSQSPTRNELAHDAFRRAEKHFEQFSLFDSKNAIALFEQAIDYDPGFALAYAELAHALAMEVRYWDGTRSAEALSAAEKAIALNPDLYQGYHAYGDIQLENGYFDSALRAYELVLDLNPRHAPTTFEIANVHFKRLDYASAKAYYLRTIANKPDHYPAMSQLGYMYLNAGDTDEAQRWLNRALESIPLQIQATVGLASIDLMKGRHIGAVSRCKKVTEIFPTNYKCLQTSAVASLLHRDLPGARIAFRKMAEVWPNDGYALLGEAQILMAEEETAKANVLIASVLDRYQERVATRDSCKTGSTDCWREYWIIAAAYALKSDRDNAYLWLDRTASAGRRDHFWDAFDPVFSALRNDAEFDAYIATTKFDYW